MDISTHDILQQAVVGLEFEFYSNMEREQVARGLEKETKKKIRVVNRYHSKVELDEGEWKLEPDFSGGSKMMELVTAPMGYYEAMAVIARVLRWIRQNGWTDEKSAFQFSVSFDEDKYRLRTPLEGIDKLKFVLEFDEEFVYERYPKRKNSKYARSIKLVRPVNKFVFNDKVNQVNPQNYTVPVDKFYGVNFTKLVDGYVEFRYMGGRSYEKRTRESAEIIQYAIERLYDTLENPEYTPMNVEYMRRILREHKKVVTSFSDVETFQMSYPNIKVFVDLRGDLEVLKTYWVHIREQLFNLIVNCGMRKGLLNYDADVGRYQLKDAIVQKAFDLTHMEVFDSKIGGNIDSCDLYRCVVKNAHITNSMLFHGNVVSKSKIIDTPIHIGNEVHDCYIDNKEMLINGKVMRGIIRSGEIAPTAKISQQTEIIDQLLQGENKMGKDNKYGKMAPDTHSNTRVGMEKK